MFESRKFDSIAAVICEFNFKFRSIHHPWTVQEKALWPLKMFPNSKLDMISIALLCTHLWARNEVFHVEKRKVSVTIIIRSAI